ncbi:MAG: heavy metal translocating P-type ATPase [Ruminococcus bromii]|nr:heavy metal translocating P-type ATPase [Ruminococcus bromii]
MILTAKHFAFKMFLPSCFRVPITIFRSLKYIKKALKSLLDCKVNVDVLDGASITSCLLQRNFKTAGTVMFLLSVSGLLEDYTHARTKAVLTDSLAIKTDKVWLVTDDGDVLIPIDDLSVGDNIRVQTGKIIPIDGTVVSGDANVNESSMTGEPLPAHKQEGDSVFAGTVVEEGSLVIRVRELASNTKISKIIDLINDSENLKAGVQSHAERLADRIVPFSFFGFFAVLAFTRNITKAVSLLMVDYSCAIKLSTPIAVISAIKEIADNKITIKGGKYLEAFANADTIVFDKTGTLTNAEPTLEKVISFSEYSEDDILRIAACLEEHFPHSVANAVVIAAAQRGLSHIEEHTQVNYIVAHGISTTLHGKRAVIGSKHFVVEDENVEITQEQQEKINEKSGACSVLYLSVGGELIGVLCISDPPRKEAKKAIELLKSHGIKNVVMLTGDSFKAAKATAEMLGITEYKYQVLPEQKHGYVERLKSDGNKVIMVVDVINDTPALAAADVSVAMSDASDIARETADITITNSDITELVRIRILSELLMRRINKNYRFIIGFNSALMLSGLIGIITPSLSALLHNASTMLICAKSMSPLIDDENDSKK